MKISSNEQLIHRNKKISQGVLYFSLAFLLIGLFWSLTNPDISQYQFSYAILIPAYILVQVSIFLSFKWGRSPRPDEIVSQSLKGLPDQFILYNYKAGVPHLLVGPAGLWIIKPYYHSGEITYDQVKKKYKQKGGPFILSKLFAQESLPDISRDSAYLIRQFDRFISKNNLHIGETPNIVNIFYSEKANLHVQNAPEPTMPSGRLKEFIRGKAKQKPLSNEEISNIVRQLPDINS